MIPTDNKTLHPFRGFGHEFGEPKMIEPLEPLNIQVQSSVDLTTLMDHQMNLMKLLGVQIHPVDDILTSDLFKDIVVCMAGEAHEALAPLTAGTKVWKHNPDAEGVRSHVMEEIVDVFFFFMEACILAGMTAKEIERAYLRKYNHIVTKRLGKEIGDATSS